MAAREVRAGKGYVELGLKDRTERGLKAVQAKLKAFAATTSKIGMATTAAGIGAVTALAFPTKIFADFDDAMLAVKATTQASDGDYAKLTETAKELGRNTSFTAVQVGSLMIELGRAGFTAKQVDVMTTSVLSLSRATGTDATLAAGIMAASIRQFGLQAEDAGRVADSLTAAANKSFNTVETLGEALSYAGPVAADFNMSIEDTLGILGALGNVGIQGSNAGTAVRRLLTITGADAEALEKIFDGVKFKDAAGNSKPLIDALAEIDDSMKGLGTAERSKKLDDAFGLLGITSASALSKGAFGARELAKEIKAAGGIAKKTSDQMDSGIGGTIRKVLSAAEGVAIAIGEKMAAALQKLEGPTVSILGGAVYLIQQYGDLIPVVAAVAVGMVVAGGALVALGATAASASTVAGLLGTTLAALTSPIGLVSLALAGGTYAWLNYTESGQRALGTLSSGMEDFRGIASETFAGVRDALATGDYQGAADVMMAGIEAATAAGLAKLNGMWEEWKSGVVNAFAEGMKAVTNLWRETQDRISRGMIRKSQEDGPGGSLARGLIGRDLRGRQKTTAENVAIAEPKFQRAANESFLLYSRLLKAAGPQDAKGVGNLTEDQERIARRVGVDISLPVDEVIAKLRAVVDVAKVDLTTREAVDVPEGKMTREDFQATLGIISTLSNRRKDMTATFQTAAEEAGLWKGTFDETVAALKMGREQFGKVLGRDVPDVDLFGGMEEIIDRQGEEAEKKTNAYWDAIKKARAEEAAAVVAGYEQRAKEAREKLAGVAQQKQQERGKRETQDQWRNLFSGAKGIVQGLWQEAGRRVDAGRAAAAKEELGAKVSRLQTATTSGWAAQAMAGGIVMPRKKEDEIAKNTKDTASQTKEVATALSNLKWPAWR